MPESINIEVFRNKNAEEFTSALKDSSSKLNSGSAAAQCAAFAASLAVRATSIILENGANEDKLEYISRNADIIRNYMVHLIDEDVKCKGPMRRALKEGGADEIEAARHPACAICGEIINMMVQLFDFLKIIKDYSNGNSLIYIRQAAYFAYCAMCVSREYILNVVSESSDDTYKFVTIRENEITFDSCEKIYHEIIL